MAKTREKVDYSADVNGGQPQNAEDAGAGGAPVYDENLAPVLDPLSDRIGHPGLPVNFTAQAMDPNGDAVTFSLISSPGTITTMGNLGNYTWTPQWTDLGSHTITVRVTDPGGLSDTRSCIVTVANQPPTLAPLSDRTAHPGVAVMFTATANDPEGDVLTFDLIGSPGTITTMGNMGNYSWTPTWADMGARTVTVRVRDPEPLSATRSCTITVANQPPVLAALANRTAHPGQPVMFTANANDPEGDTLTFALVNSPGTITSMGNMGNYTWTPGWNELGAHTVTVRVSDPGGLSDTRTCTITVANQGPTLQPLTDRTGQVNQPLMFTAQASDPEGDALTFSLINPPAGATITTMGNMGNFNWTPAPGQVGAHTITIRVADPGGLADMRSCTVTVS